MVSEGESVLVCVGVEGKLRREVTLRIDTVNGTAVGEYTTYQNWLVFINSVCYLCWLVLREYCLVFSNII